MCVAGGGGGVGGGAEIGGVEFSLWNKKRG